MIPITIISVCLSHLSKDNAHLLPDLWFCRRIIIQSINQSIYQSVILLPIYQIVKDCLEYEIVTMKPILWFFLCYLGYFLDNDCSASIPSSQPPLPHPPLPPTHLVYILFFILLKKLHTYIFFDAHNIILHSSYRMIFAFLSTRY